MDAQNWPQPLPVHSFCHLTLFTVSDDLTLLHIKPRNDGPELWEKIILESVNLVNQDTYRMVNIIIGSRQTSFDRVNCIEQILYVAQKKLNSMV
jgi:hypothetical protein